MQRSVGSSAGCQALCAGNRQHGAFSPGEGKEVEGYATGDASPGPVHEELSEGLDGPTNVPGTPAADVNELEVAGESRKSFLKLSFGCKA